MSGPVRIERQGRVATLTLDLPPLNILDLAAIGVLGRMLAQLEGDPEVQLLVLRGAGERAFSAGVSVHDHTPERVEAMLSGFHAAIRRLVGLEATTLAVVQGHCLGGGMELAASCDLILATDNSRFGQPEIKLGCFPPVAAALYPRRLGTARTLELLLTGRTIDAEEAVRIGLATWRVPPGDLELRLNEVVDELTRHSSAVTRLIKKAVAAGWNRPFPESLDEAERIYAEELSRCEDMEEGLRAFLEKRQPNWRHR